MNEIHPMSDIDLNPHDWEEVKHILMTYVPEYEVWAFGSRVSWTAKAYSDLDLAIITEKPLSLSDLAKLKEAFDESTISIKVDVVDWASTSESFRKIIENKRVLLQEAVSTKSGWKVEKLIDCTRDGNLSYGIVQPGQHAPDGIPIVRVNNFKNCQLQIDDVHKVSSEIASKYKRTCLVGGEVLLTLVGSTGQSAVVPKQMAGWNIARAVAVIRPKVEIGADWINICLQTKEVQRFLDERANTTVQKTLNLADVREIPIPIPPKAVKEEIESIALAFSKKIELNRQTNQTLEHIAQTIFKSWFVDFEPVKAKIVAKVAGNDPERAAMCAISGKSDAELDRLADEQLRQLAETAALFPDELVESDLGLIPVGWEEQRLEDLLDLSYGKALKKSGRISGHFSVYGSGGITGTHNKPLVKGPGIIVGRKGTVGSLYWEDEDFYPNDTVFYVEPKNKVPLTFLYSLLQTLGLEKMNTDAAVPGLNRNNAYRLGIPIFPDELVATFAESTNAIRRKISTTLSENKQLEEIRDALLPKLLSGEITPKKATAEVETAL
jgi:type I restriction enzyme S subunit